MSSSVVECASSHDNHEEHAKGERLDLMPLPSDSVPADRQHSLPRETFLRAALSLKDQVLAYYTRSASV